MSSVLVLLRKSKQKVRENGVSAFLSVSSTLSRRLIEANIQYLHYRAQYGASAPNPLRTISVNPQDIDYMVVPAFSFTRPRHKTYILGGDWDQRRTNDQIGIHRGEFQKQKLVRIENYEFYKSLKHHFEEGVPWKDTTFYEWAFEDARKNDIGNWYHSKEAIHARLDEIDRLYKSIRTDGYLSQRDLNHVLPATNEVQVNIGRQGEIFFDEGKHRFVISRILGIPQIPVRVFVRHEEWQKTRQEVAEATSTAQLSETARKNLDHPDMQGINPSLTQHDSNEG